MTSKKPTTIKEIDWKMLLSEIEMDIMADYITKSLDTSDQSKWGDEYLRDNTLRTDTHNKAIKLAISAYTGRLEKKLEKV